jgi:DNA-binding LytR/AlgR family response regulator
LTDPLLIHDTINHYVLNLNDSANKCIGIILNYAWKMKVIFYTAHDDYMLQAIRNSTFDYLMKPFDSNELNLMFNRFREDFVKSKMEIPILLSDVSNSFLIATPLGWV